MGATVITGTGNGGGGGQSFESISETSESVTAARRLIVNRTIDNANPNPHASLLVNTLGTGSSGADGGIQSFHSATYDCTASPQQALGLYTGVSCTKSAGAQPLTLYGLLGSVGGGDNNYLVYGTGDAHIIGVGSFTGSLTAASYAVSSGSFAVASTGEVTLGSKVQNFVVTPTSGNANIAIGGQYASGCQLTLKNRAAASSVCGIDIGLDTTVNTNAFGGVFLWRGAGGGFGGSVESAFFISCGSDQPGAVANDLCIVNWTAGRDIVVSSDGTGFTCGFRFKSDSTFAARKLRAGGSDVGGSGNGVTWQPGGGSPEGVITANIGSLYSDTTNGKLYFKASGSGNTGWREVTLV